MSRRKTDRQPVYAPETLGWLLHECEQMAKAYEADPTFDGTLTLTPPTALALVRDYRTTELARNGGADGGRPLDPMLLRYVTNAIKGGADDCGSVRKAIKRRVKDEREAKLETLAKDIGTRTVSAAMLKRYIEAAKKLMTVT